MKRFNLMFFCFLFVCIGCSESETNLQIDLVVLDSEGNETSELIDPEKFSLAIKAINNSNEEVQFFFNDCEFAQRDDHFLMREFKVELLDRFNNVIIQKQFIPSQNNYYTLSTLPNERGIYIIRLYS